MRSYETPRGPLNLLATVLFFVGLALSVVLDGTPWIGIVLMVVALLLSIALLFVRWRRERR